MHKDPKTSLYGSFHPQSVCKIPGEYDMVDFYGDSGLNTDLDTFI